MPAFRRKPNRLPRASYLGRQIYFVTIRSTRGKALFMNPQLVALLADILRAKCTAHLFNVYAFCFMPDHVHLELVALSDESNLIDMLRDFKGTSTARARPLGFRALWQKGFYDHVLRSGEAVDAVAWYILNNPVRRGLVKEMHEWPHSGSWMFDWRKLAAPLGAFIPPWKKALAG